MFNGIVTRWWRSVKDALGIRPPHPRCDTCGDQLWFEMEVEAGKCFDCDQPAVVRRAGPPILGRGLSARQPWER